MQELRLVTRLRSAKLACAEEVRSMWAPASELARVATPHARPAYLGRYIYIYMRISWERYKSKVCAPLKVSTTTARSWDRDMRYLVGLCSGTRALSRAASSAVHSDTSEWLCRRCIRSTRASHTDEASALALKWGHDMRPPFDAFSRQSSTYIQALSLSLSLSLEK